MIVRDKAEYAVILAMGVLATLFAVRNYFTQDDAYIAYVYAKNFAQGHGLVWYPGSNEYGYTSFLYTLIIGVFIWLGLPPEWASACINYGAYLGALYLACWLTWRLSSSYFASICTGIVLASNHSFSSYASGGLETMVVTVVVLVFYDRLLTMLENPAPRDHILLGVVATLTLLTRLDSAILLFPGYLYLFIQSLGIWRRQPLFMLARWLVLCGIPLLAVAVLLYSCLRYYGWPLPTSFYLKMPANHVMLPIGLHYLMKYLTLQSFIPYLILFLVGNHYLCFLRLRVGTLHYGYFLTLAGVIALWLAYIVFVGGDFMEFRLFVPILPFFVLIAFSSSAISFSTPVAKKLAALACTFLIGNATQDIGFRTAQDDSQFIDPLIETTQALYGWVHKPDVNWRNVGSTLHTLFYTGSPDDVKIAVGPAGAMPYYSGLPSLDLMGLNTRGVLVPGNYFGTGGVKPGHMIIATDNFLTQQGVNLNILVPQVVCHNPEFKDVDMMYVANPINLFTHDRHETLLLPLNKSCYFIADYRKPHPKIDALLANGTILRYKDVENKVYCPEWWCLR